MLYLSLGHVSITNPAKSRKLSYEKLQDRMKTFKLPPQWEGPLDYQSMAEAGFVYTGQEDLVFCFHCNIKLDRWSKDMEPLLRHKEESPTCSFMRQRLQAVKGERGKTKSVVAPSKPLNPRLTSSIGQLQSSSLTVSKAIHTVVTGLNEPRLSYGGSFDDRPGASLPITAENYQSEAERIKSFVGWPLNEAVHPEQLARVGFVYTGEGALVQCFQCGVKYHRWSKGDVPLSVHQKCNPRCLFLRSLSCKSKSSPPEQRPTRSNIQAEPISNNTEDEEVSKHSLQFLDYSDQAIRLQSFKHWGGVLPAQQLAVACRNVMKHFLCKAVIQDWERNDNAINEQHKYSAFLKKIFPSGKRNNNSSSSSLSVNTTYIAKPLLNNQPSELPKQSKGLNLSNKLNYDELEDRIKTFKPPPRWEGPLDYQSMAEAGFVYTGQEDLVFCFHCNIKLDKWSKDMEPLLRHKEESPTCSFMRQRLQAVKGERGKTKSVVAPSKPPNPRLTSSIGQLQSSSLTVSKAIHTVVTGLKKPRLSYGGSFDDRPRASLPITAENYSSEAERIKSFVGWPLNEAVHPEQLAHVGFVYTGEGALVQCFQCGVKYRHWYKGDVPLSVHQKCNPHCPFLQTLVSKNNSSPPKQRPTRSYIQAEPISNNTEGEEVSKHSLQFPDYSDQAIRLQSFKHWGGVLPAQELAEGGFYMIARRDVVRCFSCNVIVQDWERSDNVIDEHHKYSPNCSFLKVFLINVESFSSSEGPGVFRSPSQLAVQSQEAYSVSEFNNTTIRLCW